MQWRPFIPVLAASAIVSILASLVAGCDSTEIDPFVGGHHFTVYGFLNEFDLEHSVRVVAVRRSPEDISAPTDPHAEIDARVTSKDLTTGEEHVWVHRLIKLDDGSYGHIFSAKFLVQKGRVYELAVTRSDGAQSTAQTTVPNLTDFRLQPAVIENDVATQSIVSVGASTPDNISITYCARAVGALACSPIVIPYDRGGYRVEDGWQVDIQLTRDLAFVRQQLGFEESIPLELASMEMLFTALDSNWIVPEPPIDMNEFAQPDALTNVEGGFGFWGSLSRSVVTIDPDAEALALSGFVFPGLYY